MGTALENLEKERMKLTNIRQFSERKDSEG